MDGFGTAQRIQQGYSPAEAEEATIPRPISTLPSQVAKTTGPSLRAQNSHSAKEETTRLTGDDMGICRSLTGDALFDSSCRQTATKTTPSTTLGLSPSPSDRCRGLLDRSGQRPLHPDRARPLPADRYGVLLSN